MKWVRVMSLLFRRYCLVPTITLTKLFLPILQLLYSNLSKQRLIERAPTIPDASFFVYRFIPNVLISMNPYLLFLQFDFVSKLLFYSRIKLQPNPQELIAHLQQFLYNQWKILTTPIFRDNIFFMRVPITAKQKPTLKNYQILLKMHSNLDYKYLFLNQFAQEIGTYEAYISIFDELKVSEKLPLLKVNDVAHEMRTLINSLDFTSLTQLKLQREVLRKKYQLFKAMTAIKQQDFTKSKTGLDF